jgi:hypothetical protein
MIRHLRALVLTWLLILSTGLLLVASTATPSFAADPERPATTASYRYNYTSLVVQAPLLNGVSNHASRLGRTDRVTAAPGPSLFGGIAVAAEGGSAWTRVGRWMNPEEHANMGDMGVVQWNEQGVSHVLNPPNPAVYRAAPPGDIYVEYDVPTGVLSPNSAGSSIIYGPDSFVAKLPGRAQLGDVSVRNILIPGS